MEGWEALGRLANLQILRLNNNQIATIADLTNMADAAPTRQAQELLAELRARAAQQIARLEEIKKGGVSMFSDALQKLGVPPIRVKTDE